MAKTDSDPNLNTPTDLASNAAKTVAEALNGILADSYALYIKTKNFHWHVSGPHFRDYHLMLDEQASQILATTDAIAERVQQRVRTIEHLTGLEAEQQLERGAQVHRVRRLRRHFDDPACLRVVGDLRQAVVGCQADVAHRVADVGGAFRCERGAVNTFLQRQGDALHHGVDQIGLVLEMPIYRAACCAGALGDVLQACARYALLLEQVLGSIQQFVARFLRFFFGSTDHGISFNKLKAIRVC